MSCSAIVVEIGVLEVKPRGCAADYPDGVFNETQLPRAASIFEPSESVFPAASYDDIKVPIRIKIHRLRILWHAVASQNSFVPRVGIEWVASY
jgi:hypothetical protein